MMKLQYPKGDVALWAKQLVDQINAISDWLGPSPGPYANDAAAAAANVGLKGRYYDTSGVERRRIV
jgi:hypothetical protein